MVMKKIFEAVFDEEVHSDFLKFGRGEYKDRYLVDGKKQAKGYNIKTGPEYANFLVKKCLEKVSGEIQVKGIIVTTLDLKDEIPFDIVKVGNFQGIRKIQINTKLESKQIFDLMNKYPRAFYALSFSTDDFTLKIKEKAPKSGKPGKENEDGPKADFCTLKTNDKDLVKELIFDVDDFKEISVNNLINVTDIVYPKNMNELKPAEVRELSKRKGKITRKVTVDGKEKISEAEFVA